MSLLATDTAWFLTVNGWARVTPSVHAVVAGYALWAGPMLLGALLVAAWWLARGRGPAAVATTILTGLGAVVALLLCQDVVSELVARPRPCAALPGVQTLLSCSADFSMPSDHAVIAGAIAAGLWFSHRRLAITASALGLLLAFARVYVGVHYPSDVLAGLLFGAAVAAIVVVTSRTPATAAAAALGKTGIAWAVTAPVDHRGR